jgi:hypothetical protein
LAHHLTPDLAHLLQLTLCTHCRVCLIARSELADARHHEHAFRVVLIGTGAGGEDGGLELFEVLWWSEEDELVARGRGHDGWRFCVDVDVWWCLTVWCNGNMILTSAL